MASKVKTPEQKAKRKANRLKRLGRLAEAAAVTLPTQVPVSTGAQQYIIVKGWHHPKNGGDDYPFERGFVVGSKVTEESFRKIFKKKNRSSAMPNDFVIEFVSKQEWEKTFKVKGDPIDSIREKVPSQYTLKNNQWQVK